MNTPETGGLIEFLVSPLNQIIWIPIVGMLFVMLVPWDEVTGLRKKVVSGIAVLFTLLPAVPVLGMLNDTAARLISNLTGGVISYIPDNVFLASQGIDQNPWFQATWLRRADFHITYTVQLDGLSMAMILLSLIVFSMAAIASTQLVEEDLKRYFALFLLLQTSIYGVFMAFDYVLFFFFWELMLVPIYFLITGWGGADRQAAGLKFITYTIFGSVFMLFPIILSILEVNAGGAGGGFHSWFPRFYLGSVEQNPALAVDASTRALMFGGFMVSFMVKMPVFPLHTWMPDAHTEAPAPISMVLAGLMLKAGAYGVLRIAWPIFPDVASSFGPVLAILGGVMIIYGALLAFSQTDIKRIVAYSSLAHMGFIVAALAVQNPMGIRAAVFMMFAHGLVSAALFWLVGLLEKRTGTRSLHELGGLMQKAPRYSFLLGLAGLAAMGLPGLVVFWGEFPTIIALFGFADSWTEFATVWGMEPSTVFTVVGVAGAFGIVFAAAYVIRLLQGTLGGGLASRFEELKDLSPAEALAVSPLALLVVLFGLWPEPIYAIFQAVPAHLLSQMDRITQAISQLGTG